MRQATGGMSSSMLTTRISDLSISTGASAAQVIMTIGFWKKGSGAATTYRTNQTLQGTIVKVSGTKRFGLTFAGTVYDSPYNMRLGYIACRQSTTLAGLYSASWTYGVAPTCVRPTWLFTNLTPATTYFIEWKTTHPCSDPVGLDAKFDTHEEPGQTNYSSVNNGFFDFSGFVTDRGATFSSITLARTLKYAIIYADSNGEGRVTVGGSTPDTVYIAEHRNAIVAAGIQDTPWDSRGALAQYEWLTLDSNGTTNSYHWNIMNLSFGSIWQGAMGSNLRGYFATIFPGLPKNVVDRMFWRTNYSTTSFISGSDWTGGITPNLVWFTSFYNDTIQAYYEYVLKGAGLIASRDDAFIGGTHKDNVGRSTGSPESLLHAAYTQWTSVAIFVTTHHSTDAVWQAVARNVTYNPYATGTEVVDTKAQTLAACSSDTNYYKINAAGGTKFDANKGRFYDIQSAQATTGLDPTDITLSGLHPTYEQHVLIQGVIQSTFNALAI